MESKAYKTADDKILYVSFKDKKAKKPVPIVSSCSSNDLVLVRNKTKPITIHMYYQYINGCHRADQNLGYYGAQDRKSTK